MRLNPPRFTSTVAGLLLPAMLSLSTAQAATEVPWMGLANKIGHGKLQPDGREDRQYRVITKDGQAHIGYKITFTDTSLTLADTDPAIPREEVKEIRIRRNAPFVDALFAPAGAVFGALGGNDGGGDGYDFGIDPVAIVLYLPVGLAITAAAAPITLPILAVKRLLPDKVFKVAP